MSDEAEVQTTAPAAPVFPEKMSECIAQAVRLRDTLKRADDAHVKKTAAAREYLEQLKAVILAKLEASGEESSKTKEGTAYKSITSSATLADAALFREFIINTQQFDLVDMRANAKAISDWIDTVGKGNLPPGVNYSKIIKVGIRRPGEKE